MKKIVLPFFLLLTVLAGATPKPLKDSATVFSPDKKIRVAIDLRQKVLAYSVWHEGDNLILPSPVSLTLDGGEVLGATAGISRVQQQQKDQWITSPLYKRSHIHDVYNELSISFRENYSVTFRIYNEGMAYRFATGRKRPFRVQQEQVSFHFPNDAVATVPFVNQKEGASFEQQFFNSFENTYTTSPLTQLSDKRLAFLPLVVSGANGKRVCITEADLEHYPGMYLQHPAGSNRLEAVMAPLPKDVKWGGHNNLQELVTARENVIAESPGTQTFPWRVMAISANDAQLADNDLVYKLASPSRLADVSWIKPGKVAWDWWNDWNISGVGFQSGVNNQTYKYYIEFAAKYKMEYVILDEGWAVNGKADLLQVVPEINIPELVAYGRYRNVGIILWAGYNAFNRDMDNVAKHYAQLGVKGFKIDFMDRDDQKMVDFYYRAAETCAKYNLMADFHGAYKPTGLNRTWPNVINFEGVHGLEQMKWSPPTVDQVTYDVTIPFVRMLAGPMDYTQGAMRNATKRDYYPAWSNPMSQGTRCRQLAQYVIFESPLNMLCDNPSNYMKEPECTGFISSVPKVWDESRALVGSLGEYVAMARQKGNEWYAGAITNWEPRKMTLDLSFLTAGNYSVEIFEDGVNAAKNASDYQRRVIPLSADRQLSIQLAPGGGFAARIFEP